MKRVACKRSFLAGLFMFFTFAAVSWQAGASPALAEEEEAHNGSKAVAIVNPADNEVVNGSTVDVIIELRDRGVSGDHVHLYLDGKLVKPLYGTRVTHTLNGLSSGSHSISIKLATKKHKILDTGDSVTINIK